MAESSEPVVYADSLYRAGLLQKCLEFCELTAGRGQAVPKILLLKALCLIGLGRADEAGRVLADPLFAASADAAAQAELGAAFEARGDHDDALIRYDEALRLSPKQDSALISRACLHQKLGRHAQALEDLDAAIGLDPEEPDRRLMRLVFLFDAGRSADGEREARALIAVHPELKRRASEVLFFGPPILRLRRAQSLWADGRLDEALALCDEVLGEDPRSAAALCVKGFCLMFAEQNAPARRALDESVRLAPDVAMPHKHLGMLLQRLGDFASARASFERALALDPLDGEALLGRAEARLSLDDKSGALSDLRAASADPDCRALAEQMIRDAGLLS